MNNSSIIEINKNDCVGDSAAVHNYNTIILDTKICNLSSTLFNSSDNYDQYFQQFQTDIPYLTSAYQKFNSETIFKYKKSNAALEALSPYWNKHEFTVQLNTNISPVYSSRFVGAFLKSDFIGLCSACYDYVMTKFPPVSFMQNTTAHVMAYYYTSIESDPTSAVNVVCTPLNFTDSNREMRVDITKSSMTVSAMNIFSFSNITKNNWVLTNVLPQLPAGYEIRYTLTSN